MKRRSFITLAVFATASAAFAGSNSPNSFAVPSSLNLDFSTKPASTDVADTGFDAAYNPLPSPDPTDSNSQTAKGFYIGPAPYGTLSSNTLNIWSDGNDIYGQFEGDPDTAHNVFYSNFSTGSQTIVTSHLILQNLNNNYHGGGIWLGTDEDHYVRLGVIYNSNQGTDPVTKKPNPPKANVEMLRENQDFWAPPTSAANGGNDGASGDGNQIADEQKVITSSGLVPSEPYLDTVDVTLQLILTGHTIRSQYSLDNGSTWLPVNNIPYFAGVATSPADGASVEGGFKVGVFGFGTNSAANGAAAVSFETFSANTTTLANVMWTAGSGNASDTSNFVNLTTTANMGNEGRVYEFPTVATSHSTVTLDGVGGSLDVGGLVFSSPYGYTIAGTQPTPHTLLVNGGLIDSQAGDNVISAPLTVSGFARVDSQIHVASGSSLTLAGPTVPRLNSLAVDSGGKLDLTTNSVEIDYETPAQDPFDSIEAMVASGYDKGKWDGSGIVSSSAVAAGTGLAVYDTGVSPWGATQMFGPHYVGSDALVALIHDQADKDAATNRDVLIMYTWLGDTNLDGKVDSADFANMGTGTSGSQTWVNGDFNYDHKVNGDDYALLMLGDALQNSVLAPVPEPASVAMLLALPWIFRRRRMTSSKL